MGTLDLLLLEEIRQLSVSIQNVQDDIRHLSDKLDVHLKSFPSANCQRPSETETRCSNAQCQCHTRQGQGYVDTDVHNLGQGHREAIVDTTTFIEHPECDQSHETLQGSDSIDGQNHFQGHNHNSTLAPTNFQDRNDSQDHDDFQGHGKFGGHSAEVAVDKPIDATDSKPIQDERCSENEHNLNGLNKNDNHSCKIRDVMGNVTVVARHTTLCEETVPKVSAETMNNTSGQLRASSTNSYQYVRRSTHRRSMKERQRQCLRLAIQQNILMLLDHLPFIRGDLLDQLIEQNCLTDNECTEYTDTGNGSGKDKVRNMMRVIRGRSFEVMERFLKCLEKIAPDVVEIIRKSYEKCLKDNQVIPLCCFCLLKQSVDVKTVGDVTWSSRKISDSLYDEIVIGKVDNELLWHKFASECNSSNNVKSIITTIMNYLRQKGQYRELVNRLDRMDTMTCKCFCQLSEYDVTNLLETDSEDYTPHSSMSSVSSSQNLDSLTDDDMPNMLQFQEIRSHYSKFRRMLVRHAPLDQLQVTKDALLRSRSNSYDKQQRPQLSVLQSDTMSTRRASMFV